MRKHGNRSNSSIISRALLIGIRAEKAFASAPASVEHEKDVMLRNRQHIFETRAGEPTQSTAS